MDCGELPTVCLHGVQVKSVLSARDTNHQVLYTRNVDYELFIMSSIITPLTLGAVALQPAPPIPGYPLSQVIWPVHIVCNSSDPNATLDDCLIQLTNDNIPYPPQSSTVGFQCRRGKCTTYMCAH